MRIAHDGLNNGKSALKKEAQRVCMKSNAQTFDKKTTA